MLTRRLALGGMAGVWAGVWAAAGGLAHAAIAAPAGQRVQGGWLRGQMRDVQRLAYVADWARAGRPVAIDMPGAIAVPLAPDGSFFIGIDRDSGDQGCLLAESRGQLRVEPIAIAPRAWPIEHIDAPFHPPAVPDEAFARIRAGEVAQIDAARARDTGAQGWRQSFIWPAHGRISGRFGAQRVYRGTPGAYHSGLDIAPGAGATYVAPTDGVVVLAAPAPFTLEGNLLMLDHGMGLNSAFLHAQRLLVREGDRVVQGQPLGLVGMTGRATGPHLHWSLRWREARLDPLLILPPA
jgi:hypothetical protein